MFHVHQFRYTKCGIVTVIVLLLILAALYCGTNNKANYTWNKHEFQQRIVTPVGMDTDVMTPVYSERRRRVEMVCRARETSGATHNILLYRNLSYCVVAKAGCTFWIRVFRFLHNDTAGRRLENPFQMTRDNAHRLIKMKLYRLQNEADRKVVMETVRFLVARNPFSRLLSAYLDKLFLPGLWKTEGRRIASHIRNNSSTQSLQCGHDISFSEFLAHVARVGQVDPAALNGHWCPIDHTCDPCKFKPHIIAKQETFSSDSRFILQSVGLEQLLEGHDRANHVIDEITIITDSNYLRGASCMNRKQIARRLWRTFQVNGYLRPGSERILDTESEQTLSKDRLRGLMIEAYKARPLSSAESRIQRAEYLKEAYIKVPQSVLTGIIRVYENDFDFFGYSQSFNDVYV